MRILIAEDEICIAKALKVILEKNKYTVDIVHQGTDALDYLLQVQYDVVVLDIMMPGLDGIEVLRQARSQGITAPVLFLSAKGEMEDRVVGLDAGADDYLPKPFATKEFLARVRALTRRSGGYVPDLLCFGDLQLDCNQYLLSSGENSLRLNNKEYQLMDVFLRNPHHVFSTEHLIAKIWGLDGDTELDVIWTYIGFLRKKLKQLGTVVEIKTIRGAGYALEVGKC